MSFYRDISGLVLLVLFTIFVEMPKEDMNVFVDVNFMSISVRLESSIICFGTKMKAPDRMTSPYNWK